VDNILVTSLIFSQKILRPIELKTWHPNLRENDEYSWLADLDFLFDGEYHSK